MKQHRLTAALAAVLAEDLTTTQQATRMRETANAEQRRAGKTPDPQLKVVIFVDDKGCDLYCGFYHAEIGTLSSELVAAWLDSPAATFSEWRWTYWAPKRMVA